MTQRKASPKKTTRSADGATATAAPKKPSHRRRELVAPPSPAPTFRDELAGPRHPVGKNPPKREAWEKVTGRALYLDDLPEEGVLHGATVRSTICKGRIADVNFCAGVDWSEFTIVRAADITGRNVVKLIADDQPFLADPIIRHKHEPIMLLAHPDPEMLKRGLAAITVEYEEDRDAVVDFRQSRDVTKRYKVVKGNTAAAFRTAWRTFEGTYETPHQEQLYIENQGMVARWLDDGTLHVVGSLQCPFYINKAMMQLFNLPAEKVRIEQATTGGGFGGKEEYPSMIAGHAALLARKAGRPVKLVYDRHEDMLATTKRHPSQTTIRTAIDKERRLTAIEIDFAIDAGAYITLSPVVLSRGTIHAAGPYRCPNVLIRSEQRMTNTPPNGAFRGFGAPQSCFAMEVHLARMADELGVDPLDFRRDNSLQIGDTTATGQLLEESVSTYEVIDSTRAMADYDTLVKRAQAWNRKKDTLKRGVGVCTFFHGAGFTGSGEVTLASKVRVDIGLDGVPRVHCGSTEIGQGATTIFAQMAGEALGLPADAVEVAIPDTLDCPDSGPTVASRTTMVVGGLVFRAARELRDKLEGAVGNGWKTAAEFKKKVRTYLRKHGELTALANYEHPPNIHWDDEHYQGSAYACYGWACVIVEVAVDLRTYETRLLNCWTAQDVGRAIHPVLCAGQIEGGTLQALGWGLLEEPVFRGGEFANPNMTNYIVATALDSPPIHVTLVENPTKYSPLGAKGIGEMPMDGPAAAVVDAIHMATGLWPLDIPATPHRLYALARQGGKL